MTSSKSLMAALISERGYVRFWQSSSRNGPADRINVEFRKGWIELDFQVLSQSSITRMLLMCSQGSAFVAPANVRTNGASSRFKSSADTHEASREKGGGHAQTFCNQWNIDDTIECSSNAMLLDRAPDSRIASKWNNSDAKEPMLQLVGRSGQN